MVGLYLEVILCGCVMRQAVFTYATILTISPVQCFLYLYLLQSMSLFFILHGWITFGQTLYDCLLMVLIILFFSTKSVEFLVYNAYILNVFLLSVLVLASLCSNCFRMKF